MFLKELLKLLAENKKFPKYQHERRADIFLNFFLLGIVESEVRASVTKIIPEFPLKNIGSSRSANVDYLIYCKRTKTAYLCEFKTDSLSFRRAQLVRYLEAADKPWKQLIQDIEQIQRDSSAVYSSKYKFLLEQAKKIPASVTLEVLYIASKSVHQELLPYIKQGKVVHIALESLLERRIRTRYQTEWSIVKRALV